MYLKNVSNHVAAVLNTVVGKVGIQPGEVINLQYKILPPVPSCLKQVEEEEFLSYIEKKEGTLASVVNALKEDEQKVEEKPVVNEPNQDFDELEKVPENDIKDQGVMEFVNSLFNKEPVKDELDKEDEKILEKNALQVQITDSRDEVEKIEQQIKDLNDSWKSTKSPRKKERISKEVKELQKRLKKVNK